MSSVGELVVSIIGDVGQLKKAFSEVGKEVNQLGSKMQSAGKQMSAAGMSLTKNVTAPLLAIGGSAVYAANEMDKAYKSIRVGTGATSEALEALSSDFRSVLGKVPASVEDVGTAIADLNTRLGLTGEPLQLMSKQMLELSRITGEDLSSTIESTTRVFGDWGIAVSDQADSLDHLFKVSQTTGISMGELSRNMVQYGAPLRQMGFDYETAAALIGKFNKEGVNTELVMGSLRIALGKFAREGISDANEALRIITQQVQAAGSASEANAIAIEYFGARAGPDMAASIREGRFEIDELVASLQNSSETIMNAGEDSLTFSDELQMMKIRVFEALEPLGKQILEIFERLEPFIFGLIDLLSRLLNIFGNLPGPIQTVVIAVAGIAAAVGPLLLVIGPLVSGIGGLMTFISGAGGLSALIAGLGTTLSGVVAVVTGPIGIALAALAVAGYLIYKNWDRIGPILKDTFDNIKTAVEPVVTIIGEFVSDALAKISQWWDANGETITAGVDVLTTAAMELLSAIGDIVVFVVSILSKTVQKVLPPILALVEHVLSQILNTIVL
ncbi:MAG: phage tail tape measure protein, partial [Methanolobus sp.]|nr:phage tail tape measure protein [Methanolobus sp.]